MAIGLLKDSFIGVHVIGKLESPHHKDSDPVRGYPACEIATHHGQEWVPGRPGGSIAISSWGV